VNRHLSARLGACFALILPVLALAAPDVQPDASPEEPVLTGVNVFKECGDAYGFESEIRACVAKQAQDSQPVLRSAEAKMATTLSSHWDEDDHYIIDAQARLAAANQAFADYRAAQCDFEASLSGGRLHRNTVREACVAELNTRRAARLHDGVAYLPLKED